MLRQEIDQEDHEMIRSTYSRHYPPRTATSRRPGCLSAGSVVSVVSGNFIHETTTRTLHTMCTRYIRHARCTQCMLREMSTIQN